MFSLEKQLAIDFTVIFLHQCCLLAAGTIPSPYDEKLGALPVAKINIQQLQVFILVFGVPASVLGLLRIYQCL